MQEPRSESSHHLALYQKQCETWFKRETRSGFQGGIEGTSEDTSAHQVVLNRSDSPKPLSQSQDSVTSVQMREFECCAGCDSSRNEMIKSQSYAKMLANNISICNRHRVICESLLDVQRLSPSNIPPFPPEALLNDNGPRFSVNEDRRLRKAVRTLGEDSWHEIASTGGFAFGRTAEDLRMRWFKLCEMNYDESK